MGTQINGRGHQHPTQASKNPVKAAFRLLQRVWDQPISILAKDRGGRDCKFRFQYIDVIGNGTFGIVCRARDLSDNRIVAIKTVYQDQGHQNRELSIIRELDHPNIVGLEKYFYSCNEAGEEFLSLVLEWMPTSLDRLLKEYQQGGPAISENLIKKTILEFAKSLHYLHSLGISHRDIKPHNLLVDPASGHVKLCDFGCSKRLMEGQVNIQYICARYYRAPEIVLGWSSYGTEIDLWSLGCVMAECLIGRALFPGKNSIDQVAKIIKIMGTPTDSEMKAMGQRPKQIGSRPPLSDEEKKMSIAGVLGPRASKDCVDLLFSLLQYDPDKRIKADQIITHPYLLSVPNGEFPDFDGQSLAAEMNPPRV